MASTPADMQSFLERQRQAYAQEFPAEFPRNPGTESRYDAPLTTPEGSRIPGRLLVDVTVQYVPRQELTTRERQYVDSLQAELEEHSRRIAVELARRFGQQIELEGARRGAMARPVTHTDYFTGLETLNGTTSNGIRLSEELLARASEEATLRSYEGVVTHYPQTLEEGVETREE